MIKRIKNKKGFTLAELLIVVAIIAVLVAISIPIFTAQLEKAREATDLANIRSAYAEVSADYLTNNAAETKTVELTSDTSDWKTDAKIAGKDITAYNISGDSVDVAVDANGAVTINGVAVGN